MNLFLITSDVPFSSDDKPGVTAVHIVTYELLQVLRGLGHQITLQLLFNPYRASSQVSHEEQEQLKSLVNDGIDVLPALFPRDYIPSSRMFLARLGTAARRVLGAPFIEDFYPSNRVKGLVSSRLQDSNAGAVVTLWSPEGLAATHGEQTIPRIAYHGDVDFMPAEVRAKDQWLFSEKGIGGRSFFIKGRERFDLAQFKAVHMRLMKSVDVIANVTAANADFYTDCGHPHSIYIRNTWVDRGRPDWEELKRLPRKRIGQPIRIIGHMGYLNRTGGTYGLKYLLADLMPELEQKMAGLEYEVHIIGGGEIAPALRRYVQNKRVVMRGFVPNLQMEMDQSDVILLLNNAGSYQAAYTRHLVAWAAGLCLVVHEQSRKAIPEIVHLENALVGNTPSQIANLVRLAATDQDINWRIRMSGRATYERYFTPEIVGKALSDVCQATSVGALNTIRKRVR